MFLNCSTCFERHTAHHQELKNCNCGLWFYVRLRLLAAVMAQPWQLSAATGVWGTRGCSYSFWAPDDERCVARNVLSNWEALEWWILLQGRFLLVISIRFVLWCTDPWTSSQMSCGSGPVYQILGLKVFWLNALNFKEPTCWTLNHTLCTYHKYQN